MLDDFVRAIHCLCLSPMLCLIQRAFECADCGSEIFLKKFSIFGLFFAFLLIKLWAFKYWQWITSTVSYCFGNGMWWCERGRCKIVNDEMKLFPNKKCTRKTCLNSSVSVISSCSIDKKTWTISAIIVGHSDVTFSGDILSNITRKHKRTAACTHGITCGSRKQVDNCSVNFQLINFHF